MTVVAGCDPLKCVHLELVGVVVGFLWTDIRSKVGGEKEQNSVKINLYLYFFSTVI